MIRLYVAADLSEQSAVVLSEKQHHYVRHVMRLGVGDEIFLFNGRDGLWQSVITGSDKKKTTLTAQKMVQAQTPVLGADLYMALVKKEAFDLVVQKAVELGARSIHPIICARSVVSKANVERLQQIAVEAAEQCERLNVPTVYTPVSLVQAVRELPIGQPLAFLNERGQSKGVLKRFSEPAFFIGPEGGFTPDEIRLMSTPETAVSVHLDGTILRAETAAIAALSCYAFDIF